MKHEIYYAYWEQEWAADYDAKRALEFQRYMLEGK